MNGGVYDEWLNGDTSAILKQLQTRTIVGCGYGDRLMWITIAF